MRRSTHDVEWLDLDGSFVGLRLGYDFVAQHEGGLAGLDTAFGIRRNEDLPALDRFRATRAPSNLVCLSYSAFLSREKRSKGNRKPLQPRVNAAMLAMSFAAGKAKASNELQALAHSWDLLGSKHEGVACMWDDSEFAVFARGADVDKLMELAQAMTGCDVLLGGEAVPSWINGGVNEQGRAIARVGRNPPCFLIASKLTDDFVVSARRNYDAVAKAYGSQPEADAKM